MRALLPKFLVVSTFALLPLSGTPAVAETKTKFRLPPGVTIVSGTDAKSQSRKPSKTKKSGKGLFWFLNGGSNYDVDIIYGNENASRNSTQFVDYGDPEPLPTNGIGNLDYEPPLSVPVFDATFAKLTPQFGSAEIIRRHMSDKKNMVFSSVPIRKAILENYKSRNFEPLWIKDGKLSERATGILNYLSRAASEGLQPHSYLPMGSTSFETAATDFTNLDIEQQMMFDVSLTANALKYAKHISSGQMDPARLSLYHDVTPELTDPATSLRVISLSPFVDKYLESLAPKHPAYAALKQELLTTNASVIDSKPTFPIGRKLVKIGQRDERIEELRTRMQDLGFLDPGDAIIAEEDLDLLDKPLSKAIKSFQIANKIKATGNLDSNLVDVLNKDTTADTKLKLLASMERIRWLPRSLGNRYVFVNQAAYTADVFENGKRIWNTKVIVGKPLTQTSAFHDEFETVVFNPSWGVPQSILVNEYLPKLRRDPGYFDKIGYRVTNADGQKISSRSVNWTAYGNDLPFSVQQPPGEDNALGEVKFLFPNEHAIYMHDTPTRKLFAENNRNFSHGCVRVENPRQFASVLLGWDADEVAARIQSGESTTVRIKTPTKVHLAYFTAWPDENGKISYFSDAYERDRAIGKALAKLDTSTKSQAPKVADAAPAESIILEQ